MTEIASVKSFYSNQNKLLVLFRHTGMPVHGDSVTDLHASPIIVYYVRDVLVNGDSFYNRIFSKNEDATISNGSMIIGSLIFPTRLAFSKPTPHLIPTNDGFHLPPSCFLRPMILKRCHSSAKRKLIFFCSRPLTFREMIDCCSDLVPSECSLEE